MGWTSKRAKESVLTPSTLPDEGPGERFLKKDPEAFTEGQGLVSHGGGNVATTVKQVDKD